MATGDVEFPPLLNGLDYLESAVENLQGEPTSRALKYAILHLVAGTEVLLKARLSMEHWSLVFQQPDRATNQAWLAGEFKSCSILEAFDRLVNIGGIDLPVDARSTIDALRDKRNRLQHFGLVDSAPAVQAVAIGALNFLISFVTEHLKDEPTSPAAGESLERIRSQLAGITALVAFRLEQVAPLLDTRDVVISCPHCLQVALEPGETCVCHFCGASGDPESLARQYVWSVLGESEYTAAKGRTEWSLEHCPDCDRETLVKSVVVRRRSPDLEGLYWCCFAEAIIWEPSAIDGCMRCGRAIAIEEGGFDLCTDCLSAALDSF
jgi:hypothetical protein